MFILSTLVTTAIFNVAALIRSRLPDDIKLMHKNLLAGRDVASSKAKGTRTGIQVLDFQIQVQVLRLAGNSFKGIVCI